MDPTKQTNSCVAFYDWFGWHGVIELNVFRNAQVQYILHEVAHIGVNIRNTCAANSSFKHIVLPKITNVVGHKFHDLNTDSYILGYDQLKCRGQKHDTVFISTVVKG